MRDDSFRDYVLDQLRALDGVTSRAMFGGHGLYRSGTFFGIVHDGRLYLKTDDLTRSRYVDAGMSHFQPRPKQSLPRYFEVPPDVLDDGEALARWAAEASAPD